MINDIHAEFLKQKHRFLLKLLWLGPIVTLALAIRLMSGRFLIAGAYNWWYTMILPGSLAMMLAFTVSAEKKHGRHGLFAICVDKGRLWIAQILVNTILLFLMNLIFYLFVTAACLFFGLSISLGETLLASFVLFLTFMWQIPVFLWLSEKTGSVVSILINLFCNIGFGIFFAPTKLWFVPFAIPARLMCPIIKVMPNGLPIGGTNHLRDSSVIFTGIMITVILYVVFTVLTALWFRRREVK